MFITNQLLTVKSYKYRDCTNRAREQKIIESIPSMQRKTNTCKNICKKTYKEGKKEKCISLGRDIFCPIVLQFQTK